MPEEDEKEPSAKYEWERNGRTEKFNSSRDAIKRIMRVHEEARNNDRALTHIFWREIQDLDLNNREEYEKALSYSTIKRVRARIQSDEKEYFPTDPQSIWRRTRNSGYTGYDVVDYYRISRPEVVNEYVTYIHKKVEDEELTEEEAEQHLFGNGEDES